MCGKVISVCITAPMCPPISSSQMADAKSHIAQLQASLAERNDQMTRLESELTTQKQENEQLKEQVRG